MKIVSDIYEHRTMTFFLREPYIYCRKDSLYKNKNIKIGKQAFIVDLVFKFIVFFKSGPCTQTIKDVV